MGANNSRTNQNTNQNYDYRAGQQQYQQQQSASSQQQNTQNNRMSQQQQQFAQQQAAMAQQNQAAQMQQMQQMQMQMQQQQQMQGSGTNQTQNAQQYNQMYRSWRQTMHSKAGKNKPADDQDLKNFYIKVALNKESIKAEVSDQKLNVTFKYDTLCEAHIRINLCVTEKKNPNNAPEMFYTPNRENYIHNVGVRAGVDQVVPKGQIAFDINYLAAFELTKSIKDYYPMIISVNYQDAGAQYAMMTYCTFTKDGGQNINGVHVVKQVALINGLPFELKSIYGMQNEDGAEEGEQAVEDDNPDAECLICLSDPKDTLIMPCCHFCVCENCGKELVKAKHTCPICRGNISSLIPMKKNH